MQFQPFELADALFGADVYPLRRQKVAENFGEHLLAIRERQGSKLHRQPLGVAVDGEARQAIGLAGDDAVRRLGAGVEVQHIVA